MELEKESSQRPSRYKRVLVILVFGFSNSTDKKQNTQDTIYLPNFTFLPFRVHKTIFRTIESTTEIVRILQGAYHPDRVRTMFVTVQLSLQVAKRRSLAPDLKKKSMTATNIKLAYLRFRMQ